MEQRLEGLGIAVANRQTVDHSAIGVVRDIGVAIGRIAIHNKLGQRLVQVQLLLIVGHRVPDAGGKDGDLPVKGSTHLRQSFTGIQIGRHNEFYTAVTALGVAVTSDEPENFGMVTQIGIHDHKELCFGDVGVVAVTDGDLRLRCFYTGCDLIVGIQQGICVGEFGDGAAAIVKISVCYRGGLGSRHRTKHQNQHQQNTQHLTK